ncbi:hypothetical protein BpHYR1_015009 [Brachionus plicatilis]|uniref:Uncharacterized protein n=1 Tax=Brachionus plicatilis TaxID=10195 RepID=A0A3M7T4K3_BRAPC|nr:hypothetical protein BpHYR1_015009 [Brachionus plicatilis]
MNFNYNNFLSEYLYVHDSLTHVIVLVLGSGLSRERIITINLRKNKRERLVGYDQIIISIQSEKLRLVQFCRLLQKVKQQLFHFVSLTEQFCMKFHDVRKLGLFWAKFFSMIQALKQLNTLFLNFSDHAKVMGWKNPQTNFFNYSGSNKIVTPLGRPTAPAWLTWPISPNNLAD